MNKIKGIALTSVFIFTMFFAQPAEAKHHSGNYLRDDGCLVVWSYDTAFFGLIKYNQTEYVFCDIVLD